MMFRLEIRIIDGTICVFFTLKRGNFYIFEKSGGICAKSKLKRKSVNNSERIRSIDCENYKR